MFDRNQFFLTTYFLVSFACSGCVATTDGYYSLQTIEPDSMRAIVEDPSGSKLHPNRGDSIRITTKENLNISSRNVNWVKMVLEDANTSRVKGIVKDVRFGDEDQGNNEDVKGLLVEINFENIEKIQVWRWNKASWRLETPTAGEVAGGAVMVVICIVSLMMACK